VSPLLGDFRGLPPMLIQFAREEVLADDSNRLAERARAAGVDVTLDGYDERMHIFSMFPFLPSATVALDRVRGFAGLYFGAAGPAAAVQHGAVAADGGR
jgi:salicylate hydroxylase